MESWFCFNFSETLSVNMAPRRPAHIPLVMWYRKSPRLGTEPGWLSLLKEQLILLSSPGLHFPKSTDPDTSATCILRVSYTCVQSCKDCRTARTHAGLWLAFWSSQEGKTAWRNRPNKVNHMQVDSWTPVPGQIQWHTKKGTSPAAW